MVLETCHEENLPKSASFEKDDFDAVADTDHDPLVYPNPVRDLLTISLHTGIQSIRVVSLEGREVLKREIKTHGHVLDVSSFMPGIYFLYVQSEDKWLQTKFCKM